MTNAEFVAHQYLYCHLSDVEPEDVIKTVASCLTKDEAIAAVRILKDIMETHPDIVIEELLKE